MTHTVLHIVDDASWGGVNRLLESLTTAANGVVHDNHKILRIERGRRRPPKIEADVIVSHMAICWKNLPFFST
jgi:D-inositol-3-phosphate glycosyltransferase